MSYIEPRPPSSHEERLEVITSIHLGALLWVLAMGWAELGALEPLRWPLSAVVWFAPFLWMLRTRNFGQLLTRMPLLALIGWACWALFSSLWSGLQTTGFAFGVGLLCSGLASAWYGASFGWTKWAKTAAMSLFAFFTIGTAVAILVGSAWREDRFRGLADNPTALGVLCVVSIFCTIAGLKGNPATAAVFISVGALGLYLSNARAATLGLLLGLSFIAFFRGSTVWRIALIVAVSFLLAVGFAAVGGDSATTELVARAEDGGPDEVTTFNGRQDIWALSTESIAERPLTGHGLYGSRIVFGEFRAVGRLDWAANDAHNLWLQVAVETGFVGLSMILAAVLSIGRRLFENRNIAAAGLLIALLVNSMTESLISLPNETWLVLTAIAGATAASRGLDEAESWRPIGPVMRPSHAISVDHVSRTRVQ